MPRLLDALYPDDAVRAPQKSYEFRPGWHIPGGLGPRTMNRILKMTSEIKDFKVGRDMQFMDPD